MSTPTTPQASRTSNVHLSNSMLGQLNAIMSPSNLSVMSTMSVLDFDDWLSEFCPMTFPGSTRDHRSAARSAYHMGTALHSACLTHTSIYQKVTELQLAAWDKLQPGFMVKSSRVRVEKAHPSAEFLACLVGKVDSPAHRLSLVRVLWGLSFNAGLLQLNVLVNKLLVPLVSVGEEEESSEQPDVQALFLSKSPGLELERLSDLFASPEGKRGFLVNYLLLVAIRFVQLTREPGAANQFRVVKCNARGEAMLEESEEDYDYSYHTPSTPIGAQQQLISSIKAERPVRKQQGISTRDRRLPGDESETGFDSFSAHPYNSGVIPDGEGETVFPSETHSGRLSSRQVADWVDVDEEYEPSGEDQTESIHSEEFTPRREERGHTAALPDNANPQRTRKAREKSEGKVTSLNDSALGTDSEGMCGTLFRTAAESVKLPRTQQWGFESNPLLCEAIESTMAFYDERRQHRELDYLGLMDLRSNGSGIILFDIAGHVLHLTSDQDGKVPYKKAVNSNSSMLRVYNPDANPMIAKTVSTVASRSNLFPRSPAELTQFFNAMSQQASGNSRLKLKKPASRFETWATQLAAYQERLESTIRTRVFPNTDEWENDRHHLSLWTLLLTFHLYQWMTALVQGDLSLLVHDYNNRWEPYQTAIKDMERHLAPSVFEYHANFMMLYCARCMLVGYTKETCISAECAKVNLTLANRVTVKTSGKVFVAKEEFDSKYQEWKEKVVKAGKSTKTAVSDFRAATGCCIDDGGGTKMASKGLRRIEDYTDNQQHLPYFGWDSTFGVVMKRKDLN